MLPGFNCINKKERTENMGCFSLIETFISDERITISLSINKMSNIFLFMYHFYSLVCYSKITFLISLE